MFTSSTAVSLAATFTAASPVVRQAHQHTHGDIMAGLPEPILYAAAAGVLLISFLLFDLQGRRARRRVSRPGRRLDLLRIPGLKPVVRRRWFPFAVQLPVALLFVLIVTAGLIGAQDPQRNIAPVLTWTIWWTWLVLLVLFVGKAWCTVCPWIAISEWIRRRSFWYLKGSSPPLGRPWPKRLRNIWLAIGLFLLLTWLEIGFGVTSRPRLTALLGIAMLVMALVTVLIYERRAFCRYACLVGRVSGLYAMFSSTELRASDREVCRTCATKDCYHGNREGAPCPTHEFLGSMDRNTYCTLCTECIRSCPHDNVAWNARPFGADLFELKRARVDEAYLAVILLAMSAFHGLSMTPAWDTVVNTIRTVANVGELAAFTIGMIGVLALPAAVYYGVCVLMRLVAGEKRITAGKLFVFFAYSLLPIALFYHLSHNVQHVVYEGLTLVRISSDPFGWGWNLFGTASMPITKMLHPAVSWWAQVGLIVIGHVFGILIAHRTAYRLYPDPRQAMLSQLPILGAMVLFSLQSLWLLSQPMVMRSAM